MRRSELRDWFQARPGYWFRPKPYGYGATPVTWRGWAVTVAFIGAVLLVFFGFDQPFGLLFAAPLAFTFARIARRKTDGEWRWRWGLDA